MLALNTHAKLGKIWYKKDFWTGNTTISVDGIELKKLNSVMYTYERDGIKYTVVIQGNTFNGVKLVFSTNEAGVKPIVVPIVEPYKVYEYLIAFISTILVTLWISVGMFVPGTFFKMNAIEGLVCLALAFLGLFLAGRTEEDKYRIMILIITNVLSIGICTLTALF